MYTTMDLEKGQFATSLAGRDQGKTFIIFDIIDSEYVLLIDGKYHKLENPKKKKVKHIRKYKFVSKFITDKLTKGEKLSNIMIRKEIIKLLEDSKYEQEEANVEN